MAGSTYDAARLRPDTKPGLLQSPTVGDAEMARRHGAQPEPSLNRRWKPPDGIQLEPSRSR